MSKHTAKTLTEGLNAAATKANEPTGYEVQRHDVEDNYRDRWGYKVSGPDSERALKWVHAVTQGRLTSSNVPHCTTENGKFKKYWVYTDYVETGSYYVGD